MAAPGQKQGDSLGVPTPAHCLLVPKKKRAHSYLLRWRCPAIGRCTPGHSKVPCAAWRRDEDDQAEAPLQSSRLTRSPAAPSCRQSLLHSGPNDLPEGKGRACRTGHLHRGLPREGGQRRSCHHREPASSASRCSRGGCGDLAFPCLLAARSCCRPDGD